MRLDDVPIHLRVDDIPLHELRARRQKQLVTSAELRKQTQRNLHQFLSAELGLAEAFCKMAEGADNDTDRKERLFGRVQTALHAVQRFSPRLTDDDSRRRIRARANQLQARIN